MEPALSPASIGVPNHGNEDVFPGISYQDRDIDQLMRRVLEHDDYQAFHQLFARMYAPLCQFCYRVVAVREVAEELVSDVFFTIWKNRGRIEMTSPKAYLFTSVRNRGFDYLRKVKKSILCSLEAASHVPGDYSDCQDLLIESELNHTLERSIARLPRQCKLIFELSREQGLKYKEIAAQLNISIKTVETQMGRALKHLRQSLPS